MPLSRLASIWRGRGRDRWSPPKLRRSRQRCTVRSLAVTARHHIGESNTDALAENINHMAEQCVRSYCRDPISSAKVAIKPRSTATYVSSGHLCLDETRAVSRPGRLIQPSQRAWFRDPEDGPVRGYRGGAVVERSATRTPRRQCPGGDGGFTKEERGVGIVASRVTHADPAFDDFGSDGRRWRRGVAAGANAC